MKMSNKKGFTIVELVIVIAVIAVLAAVLIPTFSGVVDKANQSAALQTARSTLTNALNMSSNGSLTGSTSTGVYKTVIAVDGYAFEYQGNSLNAIDYPGADSSIATLKKYVEGDSNENASNNFNAILIASQNLKYTCAETATAVTAVGWYADDTTGTNLAYYSAADSNVTGKHLLSKVEIDATISAVIDAASNLTDLATSSTSYELDLDASGNYTFKNDANISVYVNSDFSKKVVVFTTFG